MTRAAIYARYSSDLQSRASIEDQIRNCTDVAKREGWDIVMSYSDYAISGSSMDRPGMQSLMRDAAEGYFDIVLTEGIDRLSRDQENIAGIYKRLSFWTVQIYSLSDGGYISDIHIGLKGTMNQLYLKDLAIKTKRGQRGRVEKGKFAGGRPAYGYSVVKRFDANGEPVRGERAINAEQAVVVRRIFKEYASGKSPRLIAKDLNSNGIVNANGNQWTAQNIVGYRLIGEGIINNELYTGKIVWNKRKNIKHPDTGKRIKRVNQNDERVSFHVPELRIIDQALWEKAKAHQEIINQNIPPHRKRRPKGLFSFLLKCGVCGGGFSKISLNRYGCTDARKKGTCNNRITIDQQKLEQTVLKGLQYHLMQPDLYLAFCEAYAKHIDELKKHTFSDVEQTKAKITKLDNDKAKLIDAIKQGIPAEAIKEEFTAIAQKREQAEKLIMSQSTPDIVLEPDLAERYQAEVNRLRKTINVDNNRHEAINLIRSLIDKIELTPDEQNKKLKVDVYGDLAGMLCIASHGKFTQGHALVKSFNDEGAPSLLSRQDKKQVMTGSRGETHGIIAEGAMCFAPSERSE